MTYVLLVRPPSGGWVLWAWADGGDATGYLDREAKRLKALGYECVIYTRWMEP